MTVTERVEDVLRRHVDEGPLPGAVALVVRGGAQEWAVAGGLAAGGGAPMARDSLFRVASVTKPMVAAVLLMLVEDGRLALDAPVARWLPELAHPVVVRTPSSPPQDVVPAVRPITVEDLLTSRSGWGFPSDFTLPAVQPLLAEGLQAPGPNPRRYLPPDAWLAALGRIPLLHQPGEGWLYNTSSELQGLLVERVLGRPLPEVMAARLFGPLGMADTGFEVPEAQRHRFTTSYRRRADGVLEVADAPDGQWSTLPEFASGAGGLVSTAADCLAFARMLLAGGTAPGGRRLLSAAGVRRMTTDRLTPSQRAGTPLFLEGQGWGYGGSVDVTRTKPWNVPGRYGWVGGTGTSFHVIPSTGTVGILLTQLAMDGPAAPAHFEDFWRCTSAGHPDAGAA